MTNEPIKQALITPVFRMSFPKLDVPKKAKDSNGKETGEPKFGLQAIFTEADLKKFMKPNDNGGFDEVDVSAICKDLAKRQWPDAPDLASIFPKNAKGMTDWPIKKGDTLIAVEQKKPKPKNLSYLAGMWQIGMTASGKYPPALALKVDGKRTILNRDEAADMAKIKKLFAGGNYARASINITPVEVNAKCYLAFYINEVMFVKQGESFGGGSLFDKFDGIEGGSDDFNPTEDFGGDEI